MHIERYYDTCYVIHKTQLQLVVRSFENKVPLQCVCICIAYTKYGVMGLRQKWC